MIISYLWLNINLKNLFLHCVYTGYIRGAPRIVVIFQFGQLPKEFRLKSIKTPIPARIVPEILFIHCNLC